MNFRNILGAVVKIAGPAVGGFVAGGPIGGGLAVVAQLAGGGEKKRAKKREIENAATPVHKATAPAAAMAAPLALIVALRAAGIELPPELASSVCADPMILAPTAGAIAVAAHQLGTGIQRAGSRR